MNERLQPTRRTEPLLREGSLDKGGLKSEIFSVGLSPALEVSLGSVARRGVPHHIVTEREFPFLQSDRDIRETLMNRLLSAPGEVVLASAQRDSCIVYILKGKEELPFGRAGVIFTQIKGEVPVPGGYWMDLWEPDISMPKRQYTALSIGHRAALSALLQLDYVLDQYWGRYLMFWHPKTYEDWRNSPEGNSTPIELQPKLARALVAAATD